MRSANVTAVNSGKSMDDASHVRTFLFSIICLRVFV